MEPIPIQAIIFDLWNTLGGKHASVSGSLFRHFGIRKNLSNDTRYERSVQLRKWKSQKDMADSFLHTFRLPRTPKNRTLVCKALRRAIRKAQPFPGMKKLLSCLSRTTALGLLSNTTCYESILPNRWGFKPYFTSQLYSWQIGSIKPSPKNFRIACKKLSQHPRSCLFIDDNPRNVAAAKQLGMKAERFRSVAQIQRVLLKRGLTSK